MKSGLVRNHKLGFREYCDASLSVLPRSSWRKRRGLRKPVTVRSRIDERRCMDFLLVQLESGTRVRILNSLDEFSRVCGAAHVATSSSGVWVVNILEAAPAQHWLPASILSDSRSEFTGMKDQAWAEENGEVDSHRPGQVRSNRLHVRLQRSHVG